MSFTGAKPTNLTRPRIPPATCRAVLAAALKLYRFAHAFDRLYRAFQNTDWAVELI